MDPDERNPAMSQYSWAPSGLMGETHWAGIASLLCGLTALVLAVFDTLTGLASLIASLSLVAALALLLPRVTASQKAASWVGVACALVAIGFLLS
jgi:hypothetical protein